MYLSATLEQKEQNMSSYFIALIDIHDPDRYDLYLAGYDEIFDRYQGKVIAVDDSPTFLEGKWPARRTVLIEFPNETELRRWYDSPEYQALAQYRRDAADAAIAIIHGRDN